MFNLSLVQLDILLAVVSLVRSNYLEEEFMFMLDSCTVFQ